MTYEQLDLFWDKAQERVRLEHELMQAAVREGVADVYVAMKQLKRTGARHGFAARPQGMAGRQLESALVGMSMTNPRRGDQHKGFYVEVAK